MENNNNDNNINNIENSLNPENKNKKTKIIILCGAVAVLIIIVVILLVFILGKKDSSEPATGITTQEVVEKSGYSEFLEQADSENPTELFSKIENKIVEDNDCRYNCQTDSESDYETKSKELIDIFYQESFFEKYDYSTVSLVNETLTSFFLSVYPEYKSLAYVGASLNEDEFFALSNTGDAYRIKITSSGNGVSIKNQADVEILNYSGRFVVTEAEPVVIEESDFLKEEDLDEDLEEELEKTQDE